MTEALDRVRRVLDGPDAPSPALAASWREAKAGLRRLDAAGLLT